jgi:hypothetical protein
MRVYSSTGRARAEYLLNKLGSNKLKLDSTRIVKTSKMNMSCLLNVQCRFLPDG